MSEMHAPLPAQVQAARAAVGLTQREAAELVHLLDAKRWGEYETGARKMDTARWHLFLLLTRQVALPARKRA